MHPLPCDGTESPLTCNPPVGVGVGLGVPMTAPLRVYPRSFESGERHAPIASDATDAMMNEREAERMRVTMPHACAR